MLLGAAGPHPPPAPGTPGRLLSPPRSERCFLGRFPPSGAQQPPGAETWPLGAGSLVSWGPQPPLGPVHTHGEAHGPRPFLLSLTAHHPPDPLLPQRPWAHTQGWTRATSGHTLAVPALLPGAGGGRAVNHMCGPAQRWKKPEGKVPEAPGECPGGVGRRGRWEGVGEGAAQGLEEGGGQLPMESPTQTHREPDPQRLHTHPWASHAHTLTGTHTCTQTHTRDTHTCHTHACTPTPSLTHTHAYRLAHTHTPRESERSGSLLHPPSVPPSQEWGGGGPGLRVGPRGGVPRSEASARGLGGAGTLTFRAQPCALLCPACVWTPRLDDLQASSTQIHGFPGCGAGGRAGGHSPMKDTALGLMMPLGSRWKSYSLPSTTTVWPALLPPWGQKPDRHPPGEDCLAPGSLGQL